MEFTLKTVTTRPESFNKRDGVITWRELGLPPPQINLVYVYYI